MNVLNKKPFLLSDACFAIAVADYFQYYLKFVWLSQMYKFVCVPFGFSMALRLFTKILKPVFAWFRHQGYHIT